jgi:type I restriction enzyme M protein
LGDLAECLATGKTPPRSGYADKDGLFLVKVGNLSGSGIRWIARERNFAPPGGRFKPAPLLKRGDILLTSCAHSPVYIAKKVDIVTQIPGWVGGAASFVGEVMLVRPAKSRIAPFALLGFLRQPATAAGIRDLVRGQTAHLYPDDLAELRIPHSVLDMAAPWPAACALLEEEAALNDKLNEIVRRQQELSAALES